MKVLVVGAGGRTGKLVVERTAAAGHQVVAFLHAHEGEGKEDPTFPAGVEVVHGDVRNPSRLDSAMSGVAAVIDCIGGTKPFLKTDLEAGSAQAILDGMFRNGGKRLLAISALGVGDSQDEGTWFYEHVIVPTFLHGSSKDKEQMEENIERSGLEYIIVRPPVLSDHQATGHVRIIGHGETAHTITRADLAQFLVDNLEPFTYVNQVVTIANS